MLNKIKTKSLAVIIFAFFLFIFIFLPFRFYEQNQILKRDLENVVSEVEKEFSLFETRDSQTMAAVLNVFLTNQYYKDAFLKQDREALYQASLPLFQQLHDNCGITHFNYHLPNGYNFLRVHNKDIYGDKAIRFTFKKAKETQETSIGMELGKTAFGLRIVKPFYNENELIGYVEFGKEIGSFLKDLKLKNDNEFAVIVKKEYLDYKQWQSVRKVAELRDNWGDFVDYLIIDTTIKQGSATQKIAEECLYDSIQNIKRVSLKESEDDGKKFVCGSFSLYDAEKRNVGSILILKDVTDLVAASNSFNKITLMVFLFVFSTLLSFYYFFNSKVIVQPIKKLVEATEALAAGNYQIRVKTKSKDELGILAEAYNKMSGKILAAQSNLESEVKTKTEELSAKKENLEDQQKAVLNILEDVEEERILTAKERDKIRTILHSIGDGVFVVNNNLEITMFNQIAADISGFSIKEAVGQRYDQVLKFVYEESGKINDKFIKEAMAQGKIKEMENHTFLVRKDGSKIPVADSAAPLFSQNKKDGKYRKVIGCVVVFRDVSREYEVDRVKTEFLSVAAHQLRTPLGSMRWNLELLLGGDMGEVPGEVKKAVSLIYESNQRLLGIVNDLLNVSRIDQGRVSDKPSIVKIAKILQKIIVDLKALADQKKVSLIIKSCANLPDIKLDPARLQDIFTNLISNAIKYNKSGGKVMIICKKLKEYVEIKISDNGIGIPKKDQKRLFTKFFRADNAIKSETEGSGMGLFVVKSYVEAWGGKIAFESQEGKGSNFTIKIPLKPKSHVLDVNLKL